MAYTQKELIENGFKGFDKSFDISLFEHGFIYSYDDPRSEGNLRVFYTIGDNHFDWSDFKADMDFWKEFDWINKKGFLRSLGIDEEDFNNDSLEMKIRFAILCCGYENVCGPYYYGGSKIIED